jgi:hypothetical protein
VDNFNATKKRTILELPSNSTLYELRNVICRVVNAFIPELRVFANGSELPPRLNGHLLYSLQL